MGSRVIMTSVRAPCDDGFLSFHPFSTSESHFHPTHVLVLQLPEQFSCSLQPAASPIARLTVQGDRAVLSISNLASPPCKIAQL